MDEGMGKRGERRGDERRENNRKGKESMLLSCGFPDQALHCVTLDGGQRPVSLTLQGERNTPLHHPCVVGGHTHVTASILTLATVKNETNSVSVRTTDRYSYNKSSNVALDNLQCLNWYC